jgi:HEAT repeat protein
VGSNEHEQAARSSLEQVLRDGGANDAAMAAWALGEIEDSASVPALLRALRSTHTPVRLAAVGALGSIEAEQARTEIERLLRDDADVAVRTHAARALGDIGSASSVRALSQALRDAAPRVQYEAVEAIENLHDLEAAPAELVAATKSSDAKLQRLAAMALAEIHDPQTLDALAGPRHACGSRGSPSHRGSTRRNRFCQGERRLDDATQGRRP